jgi:phosphoribosylformylglycinamidine cyclo-ligase
MKNLTYKDSGVDIHRADEYIGAIKGHIQQTYNQYVLNSVGGFASLIEVPKGYEHPVLVSSTDGVGTKLRIAFLANKHDTVGIDLVAMSVNDILTMGAKPLYFLDYFACGRLDEQVYQDVISGICKGCSTAGCALVGGETAEMPSFYKDGEYDLAGFVTGVIEKTEIIDGSGIRNGNVVIGLSSDGLHSNGYSLVRKILFDINNFKVQDKIKGLDGPLYEELLKPTRIYVSAVQRVMEAFKIRGMAHITGGGLPGNVERIIPDGLSTSIHVAEKEIPPVFKVLMELGNVTFEEMCSTFNMGIGYVLVVDRADEQGVINDLTGAGEKARVIGEIGRSKSGRKVAIDTDLRM